MLSDHMVLSDDAAVTENSNKIKTITPDMRAVTPQTVIESIKVSA